MKILVCGGAGYIGSHFVKYATELGHKISVIDNLSTGHKESIRTVEFHEVDIGDGSWVHKYLDANNFDLVVHFSANCLVGESVVNPEIYYMNNVCNTISLLNSMRNTGHNNIVFSSSCAIYGKDVSSKISENDNKNPINPYGQSKWFVEQILADYSKAYGLNSVSLRYFNAAGADPSGKIGEKHNPETHLIPNILKSIISGNLSPVEIYGMDYPTRDGSCIRDYIHVNDLASAHILAGEYLLNNQGCYTFNLGNGRGFSVIEVIETAKKITDQNIQYKMSGRREGDPPTLVADSSQAQSILGWKPNYDDIETIISTAWQWHKNGEIFNI